MDLEFSPEDEAFRREVRTFLRDNLPDDIRERAKRSFMYVTKEDAKVWHKIVYDQGWIAPNWPSEFGGPGWSTSQRFVYEEEYAAANCPRLNPFGLTMVGPVIYTYGTDEQKARYLPGIRSGEDVWCQGYSEPGAGSDLASVRARAVLEGDHYVVNGQKTWTSGAHKANYMFCLVRTRTEGKPQAGITFLLMDMNDPGISVEPIATMDDGHYLNDVFMDNVRVPVSDRIGNENEGWTYAKFLLGNERTGIAGVGRSKMRVDQLKAMARRAVTYGEPLIQDPDFSRKLAEVEMALQGLEVTNLRSLAAETSAGPAPGNAGAIPSLLKIKGTEIEQTINELMVDALGYYAVPYVGPEQPPIHWGSNVGRVGPEDADGVVAEHLIRRAASIFGGTNEIQKNIIAKIVLGF